MNIIQNISDGFFILWPGSCPRGGTWGYIGAKIKFRPAVCPLCSFYHLMLNQIFPGTFHQDFSQIALAR